MHKRNDPKGWRDGSVVRDLLLLKRTPFGFQHPRGGPQPSKTPVPGDPTPFSDFFGHQAHIWCIYMHVGKTPPKIKMGKKFGVDVIKRRYFQKGLAEQITMTLSVGGTIPRAGVSD